MHRSNPSRGKVLFEVLCALGMSASLAGAWMQTHATALLGAAGIAALYALAHLFDMRQPKAVEAAEPQRIDFEPAAADVIVPMVTVEAEPVVDGGDEDAEVVVAEAPRSGSGRRSGGSRKSSGRRAKAAKAEKVEETSPVEEADVPWPLAGVPEVTQQVPEMSEQAPEASDPEMEEEFIYPDEDGSAQPHIAPLFEPEPFARMQRRAFGRRGRI
jgi:hypothetical protein